MREIAVINQARVVALDGPGAGGASHKYEIDVDGKRVGAAGDAKFRLDFQNGPVKGGAGVNGVTEESLLAVLIDRLEAFQKGSCACAENAEALSFLSKAAMCLNARTARRKAAGVEGTTIEGSEPVKAEKPAPFPHAEGDTLTAEVEGKVVTGKCVKITSEFVVLDVPGAPDLKIAKKNAIGAAVGPEQPSKKSGKGKKS